MHTCNPKTLESEEGKHECKGSLRYIVSFGFQIIKKEYQRERERQREIGGRDTKTEKTELLLLIKINIIIE